MFRPEHRLRVWYRFRFRFRSMSRFRSGYRSRVGFRVRSRLRFKFGSMVVRWGGSSLFFKRVQCLGELPEFLDNVSPVYFTPLKTKLRMCMC